MSGINPQDEVKFYLTAIDEVSPVLDKLPEKARDTKKKLAKETILQYHSDIANLREELDKVRKAIRGEKDPEIRLNLRIKEQALSQAKTEINRELNNYVNTWDIHLSRLQAKFNGIKKGLMQVMDWVKWAAIWMIWAAGKAIVSLADNYEKAKNSFTTMLGSENEAQRMLSQLSDFAKKTPFELTDVRENAKQLLAMGISADKIIPTMKALGDVSAGLGVPMQRLALNFGQVMTKGKLAGQELKDFTTAGVPLLEELSKNLGKSKTEIQNMVSKGQISAEMVAQAFETMTSEGGRFADLMATQSWTLSGMRSNLSDSLAQLGEKIWLFLLPWLKESVDRIKRLFDSLDNEIEEEIEKLDGRVREMKKVADGTREAIEDLNEDLKNGNITADEYNIEFERLTGILKVAEKDIAELNAKIKEQNELLGIATSIAGGHSEALAFLEGRQNAIQDQLQDLHEKYKQGILTEQEYLDQKKALGEEYQLLEQKIQDENNAHKQEQTVYRMLSEAGMSAKEIKESLAKLKIENGEDISSLNAEAKAANATAMAYVAMAKQKAQAAVLEAKNKMNAYEDSRKGFSGALRTMRDDWSGEGINNPNGFWMTTKTREKLKNDLKIQEEYLAGIEKIEKEQNAFISGKHEKEKKGTNDKNPPKTPGGWGGGNRGQKKIEKLKKTLKEQRDIEVKAIQESILDEETKAKKLADIKEKYDARLKQIDGKTIDDMLKNAQEYHKKVEDSKKKSLKEDEKVMDKMRKIFRDGWEKMKKDASQALKEIENEKKNLTREHKNDLASRYTDIQKSIQETEREYSGIQGIAEQYSLEELEELNKSKDAKIGDIDVDRVIEYAKRLGELKLLNENLTEEERKKALEFSKQSETQKLINKYKEEELKLIERANILNAIKSSEKDEDWIWELKIRYDEEAEKYYYTDIEGKEQEITDIKNRQLVQQYLDKEIALHNQAQQEIEAWQKRIEWEKNAAKEIAEIHKISTKNYQEELDKRKDAVRSYVDNVKAMMAEINEAKAKAQSASITNNNQVTNSNNRTTNNYITNVSSWSSRFSGVAGLK